MRRRTRWGVAQRRRLALAFALALAVPVAGSRSLAYQPPMEHSEHCPMPEQNRGAPTVLSLPAPPPAPTLQPATAHAMAAPLVLPEQDAPDPAPALAYEARAPPGDAATTP